MNMGKKIVIWLSAVVLFLSGCGFLSGTDGEDGELSGDFYVLWDGQSGLSADLYALDALMARYPDARFEVVPIRRWHYFFQGIDQSPNFFELQKENIYGDLILFEDTVMPHLVDSGYLEPLDVYIDADPYMRDEFDSGVWSRLEERGDGHVYGIPLGKNVYALYYNTAFFDELGLPRPSDGMTWEEVFELARLINDHPSRGDRLAFAMPDYNLPASQLNARIADPASGDLVLEDPVWERLTGFFREMRQLQGDSPYIENPYIRFAYNRIFMVAGRYLGVKNGTSTRAAQEFQAANAEWDIAAFPVFADAPDTGPAPAYYYLGIPKTSGRKQEAFQLISHLLSDEVQKENSKNALASARLDAGLNSGFGTGDPQLAGKRVEAFFRHPSEGSLDRHLDYNLQEAIRQWVPYLHDQYAVLGDDRLVLEEYRKVLVDVLNMQEEEKSKPPGDARPIRPQKVPGDIE